MLRPSQYVWPHAVSLIDIDFDGDTSYFDRIKVQIDQRGYIEAGIDVPSSFDNGDYYKRCPTPHAAEVAQIAYERDRAKIRAAQDEKIDKDWKSVGESIAKRRNLRLRSLLDDKDNLIAAAERWLAGETVLDLTIALDIEGHHEGLIRGFRNLCLHVLVPSDDFDGRIQIQLMHQLYGSEFGSVMRLAKVLNWGR